ncbi:MAG: ABC transporter permease [Thermoplasmata archaeon]|nr:ABC transporter permease [Thermoplasmata archaeon]
MNEIYNILKIAKKEFMDNLRNKWMIALSVIFLILILVSSYFGTAQQTGKVGWSDISITIIAMMALVQLLIPIISLMLSYAAIVGEIERGSMNLLLSYPVSRIEVVIGKFIGLSAVVSSSILLGFGIGGIVIAINASINLQEYAIFIIASILLAMSYISISIMFSAILKRRSTAMGAAIFLFFLFAMIWRMISFGILVMSGSSIENPPDWYYAFNLINPVQSFSTIVTLNLHLMKDVASVYHPPSFYNSWTASAILIMWILLPIIIAIYYFNKRDI